MSWKAAAAEARRPKRADAVITIGIIGAGATVAAVLITHWLGQRNGEERANHVRDEMLGRMTSLDGRMTEVKTDLNARLAEMKSDSKTDLQAARTDLQAVKADLHSALLDVRSELGNNSARVEARIDGIKEVFSLELKALKAEILAALPERIRRAGGSDIHEE